MKKIKMYLLLCLLVGLVTFGGAADVEASSRVPQNAQSTATVTYTAGGSVQPPTETTTVAKGTAPVKTGVQEWMGGYSLLLAGSALMILLALLAKERREREENQF